jgi:hypothetical protein
MFPAGVVGVAGVLDATGLVSTAILLSRSSRAEDEVFTAAHEVSTVGRWGIDEPRFEQRRWREGSTIGVPLLNKGINWGWTKESLRFLVAGGEEEAMDVAVVDTDIAVV